jgi:DNA-binding transcriptional regulator YiaG
MMIEFNETLKAARAATGLSQQAMADQMLIPKRTIEAWETGERTPPPYVQRFVLNELATMKKEG